MHIGSLQALPLSGDRYKLTEQGKEMAQYYGVKVTPEGHLPVEESKRLRWITKSVRRKANTHRHVQSTSFLHRHTEGRLWIGGR